MMPPLIPFLTVVGLALIGWLAARARARVLRLTAADRRTVSLPAFHGWFVAIWMVTPALLAATVWLALTPQLATRAVLAQPVAASLPAFTFERAAILAQARNAAANPGTPVHNPAAAPLVEPFRVALNRTALTGLALVMALALAGGAQAWLRLSPAFPARQRVQRSAILFLLGASLVAILVTLGIVVSLLLETLRFFELVDPFAFLTGTNWQPDPMAAAGGPISAAYGAVPLFWGTLFIGAVIAMAVAVPLGLMSAIYLTQYARPGVRRWFKPMLEILAGVPTVVYGFFAALVVAPWVRDLGLTLGFPGVSAESALAAGLVMGVMIIPYISSMADDSLAAVPSILRDGSLALGATTAETITRVLLPAALPGIVAGIMLAISRAIGETMIVVMAAGATAVLSANPFRSMTTVTYQIVALLTGEGSFDNPATLAAFALGMVLFLITLSLNFVALVVVGRFRESYR